MDSGAFEVVLADGQHVVVRRIADGDAAAWTAYADGNTAPIGISRLVKRSGRRSGYVEVAVAPEYRERGLGKILFDTLLMSSLERGFDRLFARVKARSWLGRRLRRRTRNAGERRSHPRCPETADDPSRPWTSRPYLLETT